MAKTGPARLSPRERQILDILFRLGSATVAEVRAAMSDPPAYDSVRTTLRILEGKEHVRHQQDGPRYVYQPLVSRKVAQRDAVNHLVNTFFQGSVKLAALALLKNSDLSKGELDELERLIDKSEGEE